MPSKTCHPEKRKVNHPPASGRSRAQSGWREEKGGKEMGRSAMMSDEKINDEAEVVRELAKNGDVRWRSTATHDHDLILQTTETNDEIAEMHDDKMPPDVIVEGNERVWREWWKNTMGNEEESRVSVENMWPCISEKEISRKGRKVKRRVGNEGQKGMKKRRSSLLE